MQALEGERNQINKLYSQIMSDRRHQNLEILSMEEITQRRFGEWSMALVYLNKEDPMIQMAHPQFDPYSASANDAMSLFDDLIKSSSPIVSRD
jgi:hypothetical protein